MHLRGDRLGWMSGNTTWLIPSAARPVERSCFLLLQLLLLLLHVTRMCGKSHVCDVELSELWFCAVLTRSKLGRLGSITSFRLFFFGFFYLPHG